MQIFVPPKDEAGSRRFALPRAVLAVPLAFALLSFAFNIVESVRHGWNRPERPTDGLSFDNMALNMARGRGIGFYWSDPEFRAPYAAANEDGRFDGLLSQQGDFVPSALKPPGYPAVLALAYALFGRSFAVIHLINSAAVAAAIGLAVALAYRWAGPVAAVAVGLLAVVDKSLQHTAAENMTEPLAVFSLLLLVATLVAALRRGTWRAAALAGGVMAWCVLLRTAFAPLIGLGAVLILTFVVRQDRVRRGLKRRWLVTVHSGCPDFRGDEAVSVPQGVSAAKVGLSPLAEKWTSPRTAREGIRAPEVDATRHRRSWPISRLHLWIDWRAVRLAAVFLAVALLIPTPWFVRNCLFLQTLAPLGSQGGESLSGAYSDESVALDGDWSLDAAERVWNEYRTAHSAELIAVAPGELERHILDGGRLAAHQWIAENIDALPGMFLGRLRTTWARYLVWRWPPRLLLALALALAAPWAARDRRTALVLWSFLAANTLLCMALYPAGGRLQMPFGLLVLLLAGMSIDALARRFSRADQIKVDTDEQVIVLTPPLPDAAATRNKAA